MVADLNLDNAQQVADELGGPDKAVAVKVDVSDEAAVAAGAGRGRAGVRRGGPGGQQRRAVAVQAAAGDHRQGLGPAARRDGQGLVPGLPGGGAGDDRPGAGRGHRLHLQQELGVRRPEQHRLLGRQGRPGPPGPAAGRRARCATASGSTASTPTASCAARGSSPAAGAPSAPRSTGSRKKTSGAYYAKRTLLGKEVLPEHVADAVFALTGGDLSQTTGLHIPVDSGVAAAFLR